MTAVLDEPSVRQASVDRRRATGALAAVEGVRLLRSPVTLVAALLFLAPWGYSWIAGTANEYPVLAEETVTLQLFAMLTFGNAALIAANLAALRPHRHRADVLFEVLLLPTAWRTGALLIAVLAPAALALLIVGARLGVLALLPGAAGRLVPFDVLAVPAVVVLFGVGGVLLARLARTAVVAPLVGLLLTAMTFVIATTGRTRLLQPVVTSEFPTALPLEILGRPAGRHLVYVLGLAAVLAVAALVRSGAGGRVWLAGGLAAAVCVGGAVSQLPADGAVQAARRTATDTPATMQTCRSLDDVRYCAFDDFAPWRASWNAVLQDVRRAVPEVGGPPLAVRQRILATRNPSLETTGSAQVDRALAEKVERANVEAGTPEAIGVGTQWGDQRSEAIFASAVAFRLIVGRTWRGEPSLCGSRGALLVWLVGQANPRVAAGLRELDETSWSSLVFGDSSGVGMLGVPDPDAAAGLALLEKPTDDARALVRQHWAELAAPGTDADRFAAIVGVPAAPQPPAEERIQC